MKICAVFSAVFLAICLSGSTRDPWNAADLVQPAALAAQLREGSKAGILHVGFGMLYRSKHIPGSIYAGPAAKPEGIQHLLDAVKTLDRGAPLILYCGCCPFDHCPNVRPAFAAWTKAGFRNVKVLVIQEDFTKDWVDHGYPVEGQTAKQ